MHQRVRTVNSQKISVTYSKKSFYYSIIQQWKQERGLSVEDGLDVNERGEAKPLLLLHPGLLRRRVMSEQARHRARALKRDLDHVDEEKEEEPVDFTKVIKTTDTFTQTA